MNLNARTRFWLDLFIFTAFLTFMQPALTGIALVAVHVGLHWDWIVGMASRIFKGNGHRKLAPVKVVHSSE